ncbi:phosphatase PAP2 family protein [Amnibacterium setariae]|uniref:Phosphatase PAP2 family protein n=1 Tax=Amnibacterium setariae TaxID=2306585 RepID=A0A3A1U4I5_9MICO|nr:phosphatase PAP2 family protein [Amnibacterium setariae]RIX27884.1 phosphatase PAP2 family protein [Amnibacterium setariae]
MIPLGRRGRCALAIAGAAGLAAVTASAVAVRGLHGVPGLAVDADWARLVAEHRAPGVVLPSEVLAALGGAPGSLVVAAAMTAALWWRRGRRTALGFAVAAALDEVLITALKLLDQRPGPSGALFEDRGSFPSGHTGYAAVVAVVLALTARRPATRVAALALIPVMAVSRTVVDAHWLTDTIAGAACGAAVAALTVAVLAPPAATAHPRMPE